MNPSVLKRIVTVEISFPCHCFKFEAPYLKASHLSSISMSELYEAWIQKTNVKLEI